MAAQKRGRIWLLAPVGVVALALTIGFVSMHPYGTLLNWVVRGMAFLGYQTLFLSIISSAYIRQLVRLFGRPFIKVHHTIAVAGLVMVTLHPIGVAIDWVDASVLLPRFDSLRVFLQFGGSPAWLLVAAASLTAALPKVIGRNWRLVHLLNYVAFLLVTVHALMIGTDFQQGVARAVPIVMALVVAAVFAQRRLVKGRRGPVTERR